MAEALAEYWHRRIREEWGFADEDGPSLAGLFRQQYRGGRYSWGYPACPDLEDNAKVAELLDADRIGIEVSEETGFQYQPEQTTSRHHLPPPQGQVLRRPLGRCSWARRRDNRRMPTGYGGTYRASVVDNADPMLQNRLLVVVPDVTGSQSAWAMPSLASGGAPLPAVGDDVHVSYEQGDSEYPVWQSIAAGPAEPAPGGYEGMYRATVVDNVDPLRSYRVLVAVPEVAGNESMWAIRSPALADAEGLPPVGVDVWVQFEHGDPGYPVWVGLAQ